MKNLVLSFLFTATLIATLVPSELLAGQRRRVVVHQPARHTTVVVHAGHPIHRALPVNVVVRPAHNPVVVGAPLVFLPTVTWHATVVSLPAREHLVWQDSETISPNEDWVDTNFGIDAEGDALFMNINGKSKLNFAEITFANGNVQVVDFNERTQGSGVYKLLDFAGRRRVSSVRILAKSESDRTQLSVYLST